MAYPLQKLGWFLHLTLHKCIDIFVVDCSRKIILKSSVAKLGLNNYIYFKFITGRTFMRIHTMIGVKLKSFQNNFSCHATSSKKDRIGSGSEMAGFCVSGCGWV